MQRTGNLKEEFLSFENLYAAYKKAYRGTKSYQAYEFAFNADREILRLQSELASGVYEPGDYSYFTIQEPKERIISIAAFRDWVVHHALVNVLEPIYEKRFIHDSYATRKLKGAHKAILRAKEYMRKNRWYLKMDIRKYFDSINHSILNQIITRRIKDHYILDLCRIIIDKGGNGASGLPIGNLTSQFFANVYLDIFDHFIKDRMRIKWYIRYMDDFCIFSNERLWLKKFKNQVTSFLQEELMLGIKESATLINSGLHGLPFLGVRIFPAMIRHRKENFKRSYDKLKKNQWLYENESISYEKYCSSMQSLTAHLNYYGNNLLRCELFNKGMVLKAVPTA
jgi:retron-type reverse transcriptase